MNNLEKLSLRIDKVYSLVECIEGAMLDAAADTEFTDSMKRLQNLVYVLMDEQQAMAEEFDKVMQDKKVCDAILATKYVRKLEQELKSK